ncbi:Na/Pi cotransporter family protein [Romboutsia sedimentorum]|uniref:Na/Pi cotransporter family protein n=1 Tax=Romboutsia sedimentorum TaxID=1368474 RepID=A0ABT7E6E7_9FIRM|nr:Na/Pi cotransporter family protein [Romboutsia sedimentorum]MDK2562501.1 Na/Pi cotransporter family protein [Romboutsia sedimentorum]MDK2584743.1 Na/Pi cotransporter family protein [Romboutsia sedimentorum]
MSIFISLIGGLGLFLYGMNLMGEGLQKSTGPKLEKAIELLTSNVVMGVLVGAIVTGIIQSSGATTVMVVGFVNAGIMTLFQAIGVIMGANIGTTVTAQLVSFDASILSSIALGVGIVLYMIGSKSKPNLKNISEILIGFAILFIGMEFMKDAVAPLSEYEGFRNILTGLADHPLLALLAGFAMTTCLQSSSASMGILIALSSQGLIPLAGALPILYGDNIGSCTTSLISSFGANKNAKRAALMHLCFNVIGTMLFMLILNKPITMIVTHLDPTDTARQIANSHSLFNLANVCILLPFSKYIVKLALFLIPDKNDEDEYDSRITKYLDERMLETPSIAFGNTIRETLRMGNKAKKSFTCSMNALLEKSEEDANETFEKEKILDQQQKKVLDYLIKLSNKTLDDKMRFSLDLLFHTVNDIERVGDLSENIAELAQLSIKTKAVVSDNATSEVVDMYEKVLKAYTLSLDAMKQNNIALAKDVLKIEDEVNALDKLYRSNHMNRLNKHSCSIDSGIIYLDLLTNLERISDHSASIAKRVLKVNQAL